MAKEHILSLGKYDLYVHTILWTSLYGQNMTDTTSFKGRKGLWPAVWPDIGIKSNPNFEIEAQKITKICFYQKVTYVKIVPKITKYLGLFK